MSRARKRVREERPRVKVSEIARGRLLDRFVQAVMTQDKPALINLLATDVTWVSDGGGKARAALKPVHGSEHVSKFVLAIFSRPDAAAEFRTVAINDETGLALYHKGQLMSVITIQTDGARILDFFCTLNPEKLGTFKEHS